MIKYAYSFFHELTVTCFPIFYHISDKVQGKQSIHDLLRSGTPNRRTAFSVLTQHPDNDTLFSFILGLISGASFYSYATAKAEEETTPFIENLDEMGMRRKKKKDSVLMGADGDGDADADADAVCGGSAGNLSSTVKKLYMWEKKLLREVKVYTLSSFPLSYIWNLLLFPKFFHCLILLGSNGNS